MVYDVVPVPQVTIHLGGKVLSTWSIKNISTNVRCSTKESQPSCPVHLSYNVQTLLSRYKVSDKDDGQLLSCEVNTSHSLTIDSRHRHHHRRYHEIIFSSRSFAVNVRCKCFVYLIKNYDIYTTYNINHHTITTTEINTFNYFQSRHFR